MEVVVGGGGGGGEEVGVAEEEIRVEDGITEDERLVDVDIRVLEGVVELVNALTDEVGTEELVKLISDATLMIGTEGVGVGETDSGLNGEHIIEISYSNIHTWVRHTSNDIVWSQHCYQQSRLRLLRPRFPICQYLNVFRAIPSSWYILQHRHSDLEVDEHIRGQS